MKAEVRAEYESKLRDIYRALGGIIEASAGSNQQHVYNMMGNSRYTQARGIVLDRLGERYEKIKATNPNFDGDCIGNPMVTAYKRSLSGVVSEMVPEYVDAMPALYTNQQLRNIFTGSLAKMFEADRWVLEIPNKNGTVKYVPRKDTSLDDIFIGETIGSIANAVTKKSLEDTLKNAMGEEAYKSMFSNQ
jgi:hypothetical protein